MVVSQNGWFIMVLLILSIYLSTGWWLTYPSEKYEFVNGVGIIPYIMENNKYLKPPTSRYMCVELCGYAKSPQLGRQSTVEKRNMMANWILHKLI